MYRERMLNYYPPILQSIVELKAIVDSESSEISQVNEGVASIISDAYLLTMSEERITQWEKLLGIRSLEGSTIEARRDTIIARIRGQGKLNTETLNNIVKAFTGAGCKAWIEDSVLYVKLLPNIYHVEYSVENIIQEISNKIPAHLGLSVEKSWQAWKNVNESQTSWQTTKNIYGTWENVLYNTRNTPNILGESKLDSFYLG